MRAWEVDLHPTLEASSKNTLGRGLAGHETLSWIHKDWEHGEGDPNLSDPLTPRPGVPGS